MTELTTDKPISTFDFLFIGLGAANCLLILQLKNNGLLHGKTIAIVEPDNKTTNDRTFCFWATEADILNLKINNLISYSWDNIEINGINKERIAPLHYFHVKGIDLYTETKNILSHHNVRLFNTLLTEKPSIKANCFEIILANESITVNKVFDSRPPAFNPTLKNQSHLYQSFYGWKIKTTTKFFDVSTMVMMDFNVPQNNYTQFVYILPYDENTALIELTRFGDQKLLKEESQLILADYIEKIGVSYDILEHEQGVIPMSSANIVTDDFGKNWINVGARANMLKSTSGYAFHAMAEDALIQTEAIKKNQVPIRKPKKQRFVFYDRLLLKILSEKPENGKLIFETLFKKVAVPKVLSFLREKTNLVDEAFIFSKLPKRLFIQTAVQDFFFRFKKLPVLVLPFLFTVISLLFSLNHFKYISWSILAVGFLSVGLSHGALDHLTSSKISNKKQFLYFILNYLLKAIFLAVIWWVFPDAALVIFIAYSAWHFGQADFKEWQIKQGWQSFFWGLIVLMSILFFHFTELNSILQQIPNLQSVNLLKKISETQLIILQICIVGSGVFIAVLNKTKFILLTLTYLLLANMLPLLVAFGIYFVGQHSMHGWRHLLIALNERSFRLWLKSLPFSLGAIVIILSIPFFAGSNYVGIFFVLLSCLSIPHVISMHRFYSKLQ